MAIILVQAIRRHGVFVVRGGTAITVQTVRVNDSSNVFEFMGIPGSGFLSRIGCLADLVLDFIFGDLVLLGARADIFANKNLSQRVK